MTPRFQLDSFEQLPAGDGDATLRVAGRWTVSPGEPAPSPALLVDDGTRTYRLTADSSEHGPPAGAAGETVPWRGSFTAPRVVAEAERVAFALESGPSGIVDLPRPGGVLAEMPGPASDPTPAPEPPAPAPEPPAPAPDPSPPPEPVPAAPEPAPPAVTPFEPTRLRADEMPQSVVPPPPAGTGTPSDAAPPAESRLLSSLADIQDALAQAERQTSEILTLRQALGIAERERERTRALADEALRRATAAESELDAARARLSMQERDLQLAQSAADQGARVSEACARSDRHGARPSPSSSGASASTPMRSRIATPT